MKMDKILYDLLAEEAEELDGDIRKYSGRSMYGAECVAVIVRQVRTYEFINNVARRVYTEIEEGLEWQWESMLNNLHEDMIGRDSIVIYFPKFEIPEE